MMEGDDNSCSDPTGAMSDDNNIATIPLESGPGAGVIEDGWKDSDDEWGDAWLEGDEKPAAAPQVRPTITPVQPITVETMKDPKEVIHHVIPVDVTPQAVENHDTDEKLVKPDESNPENQAERAETKEEVFTVSNDRFATPEGSAIEKSPQLSAASAFTPISASPFTPKPVSVPPSAPACPTPSVPAPVPATVPASIPPAVPPAVPSLSAFTLPALPIPTAMTTVEQDTEAPLINTNPISPNKDLTREEGAKQTESEEGKLPEIPSEPTDAGAATKKQVSFKWEEKDITELTTSLGEDSSEHQNVAEWDTSMNRVVKTLLRQSTPASKRRQRQRGANSNVEQDNWSRWLGDADQEESTLDEVQTQAVKSILDLCLVSYMTVLCLPTLSPASSTSGESGKGPSSEGKQEGAAGVAEGSNNGQKEGDLSQNGEDGNNDFTPVSAVLSFWENILVSDLKAQPDVAGSAMVDLNMLQQLVLQLQGHEESEKAKKGLSMNGAQQEAMFSSDENGASQTTSCNTENSNGTTPTIENLVSTLLKELMGRVFKVHNETDVFEVKEFTSIGSSSLDDSASPTDENAEKSLTTADMRTVGVRLKAKWLRKIPDILNHYFDNETTPEDGGDIVLKANNHILEDCSADLSNANQRRSVQEHRWHAAFSVVCQNLLVSSDDDTSGGKKLRQFSVRERPAESMLQKEYDFALLNLPMHRFCSLSKLQDILKGDSFTNVDSVLVKEYQCVKSALIDILANKKYVEMRLLQYVPLASLYSESLNKESTALGEKHDNSVDEVDTEKQLLRNGLLILDDYYRVLLFHLSNQELREKFAEIGDVDASLKEFIQEGKGATSIECEHIPCLTFTQLHSVFGECVADMWDHFYGSGSGSKQKIDDEILRSEGVLGARRRVREEILARYRKRIRMDEERMKMEEEDAKEPPSEATERESEQSKTSADGEAAGEDKSEKEGSQEVEKEVEKEGEKGSGNDGDGGGSMHPNDANVSKSTSGGTQTLETTSEPQVSLPLWTALGRVAHSAAVSLGRHTMHLTGPASPSSPALHAAYSEDEQETDHMDLAADAAKQDVHESHGDVQEQCSISRKIALEERKLYEQALVIFEQVQEAEEERALTTGQGKLSLQQREKLSHRYIQNQLDVADTLTCMAYVDDVKLFQSQNAIDEYKRALDLYRFHYGNFHASVVSALHNIAVLHVTQLEYKSALQCWKGVLASHHHNRQQQTEALSDPLEIAYTYQCIGRVHQQLREPTLELQCYKVALSLLDKQDADAGSLQQPNREEEHAQAALIAAEEARDLRKYLLAHMGRLLYSNQNYSDAVTYIEEAVQIDSEDSAKNEASVEVVESVEANKGQMAFGRGELQNMYFELGMSYFETNEQKDAGKYLGLFLDYVNKAGIVRPPLLQAPSRAQKKSEEKLTEKTEGDTVAAMETEQSQPDSGACERAMRALFCIGKLEELKGEYDVSTSCFLQVAERAKELRAKEGENGDFLEAFISLRADALFHLGTLYTRTGVHEPMMVLQEALQNYDELITLCDKQNNMNQSSAEQEENVEVVNGEGSSVHDVPRSKPQTENGEDVVPNKNGAEANGSSPQTQNGTVPDEGENTATSGMSVGQVELKMARVWNLIGFNHFQQHEFDSAKRCYKSALQIHRSRLDIGGLMESCETITDTSNDASYVEDEYVNDMAENLYTIGLLYGDPRHEHTSTETALKYLQEAAHMMEQLTKKRERMGANYSKMIVSKQAVFLMEGLNSSGTNHDAILLCYQKLLPLIRNVLSGDPLKMNEELSDISCKMGNIYGKMGDFNSAAVCYERALQYSRRNGLGPTDLMYGSLKHNLGIVHEKQGQIERAEKCYLEALDVSASQLGANSETVADTLHNLGNVYCAKQEFKTAAGYYRRCLKIRQSLHGQLHISVAHTLHQLAGIHVHWRESDDAMKCFVEALRIRRKLLGTDHQSVADTVFNIASIHLEREEYGTALQCFEEALRIRKASLGDHPFTALTIHNIAMINEIKGEKDVALRNFTEEIRIYRAIRDGEQNDYSLRIAEALLSLGRLLQDMGEDGESIEPLQEALGTFQAMQQHDMSPALSQSIVATFHSLGLAHDRTKDYGKALFCYEKVITAYRSELGQDHLDVAKMVHRVGDIFGKQLEYSKAMRCYEDALPVYVQCLGESHQIIADIHYAIAYLCGFSGGCDEKALIHYEEYVRVTEHAGRQDGGDDKMIECLKEVLRLSNMMLWVEEAENEEKAAVLLKLGNAYAKKRIFSEAIACYRQALGIQKLLLGDTHLDVANTLHNLGNAYYNISHYQEALQMFEESLVLAKSHLGSNHEEVAETVQCRGNALRQLGSLDEAMECYQESLRVRRSLFGDDDLSVSNSLFNAGLIHDLRGSLNDALKCFKDALRIRRLVLGNDHIEVANTIQGIANVHAHRSEYQKAMHCFNEAIRVQKLVLGEEHVCVANSLLNIGAVHDGLHHFNDAMSCYQQASRLYRKHLGDESHQFALSLNNIALVNIEKNQLNEAVSGLEQALHIFEKIYGKNHADVANTLHNLGVAYDKMDLLQKALECYLQSAQICKSFDIEDEKLAKTLHNMGIIYAKSKKNDEAVTCFTGALRVRKAVLANKHEEVAETEHCLGKVLIEIGQNDEAFEHLTNALRAKLPVLGREDLSVADTLFCLGTVHTRRKELVDAMKCLRESLRIRKEKYGDAHEDVIEVHLSLGYACRESNQIEDALRHFAEALRVKVLIKGRNHLEVSEVLFVKGQTHLDVGDIEEALQCFTETLRIQQNELGSDHLNVGITLESTGFVYEKKSNFVQAMRFYERAMHVFKLQLTSEHAKVAQLLHRMAGVRYENGDLDGALQFFSDARRIKTICFGENDKEVADTLYMLGKTFLKTSRYEEATVNLEKAIVLQRESDTEGNDMDVARSAESLGIALVNTGRSREALESFLEAINIYESQPSKSDMLDHLITCYTAAVLLIEDKVGKEHLEVADLLLKLGNAYAQSRQYDDAVRHFKEVLRIQQGILGEDHLSVANTMFNLGNAESERNNMKRAEGYLSKSLQLTKGLLGSDHVDVASTLHNLASVCKSLSEYDRSLKLYQEALRIRQLRLGDDSLEVANTLHKLGIVHEALGNNGKAMGCYKECLRIRKLGLGGDNLALSSVIFSMGNVHRVQLEYERAVQCYDEVIRIRRLLLQGGDLLVANTTFNIASIQSEMGEEDRSKQMLEEAFDEYKLVFGDALLEGTGIATAGEKLETNMDLERARQLHESMLKYQQRSQDVKVDLADALFHVASLLEKMSEDKEAVKFFSEALKLYRQHFGDDSLMIATAQYSLGLIYARKTQHYDDAVKCFIEAARIRKLKLGADHESVEQTFRSLGNIYHEMGLEEEASSCYKEAADAKEARTGEGQLDDADTLFRLGMSYSEKGDFDKALKLLERTLGKRKMMLGISHADVARTLHSIGNVLREMGDHGTATERLKAGLEIMRNASGENDLEVANILFSMGVTYREKGLYDEAMECYQEALDIRTSTLGENVHAARTLNSIGIVHYEKKEYSEAVPCFEKALAIVRSILGDDHEEVGYSLHCLATAYRELNQPDKSLECFGEALRIEEIKLGGTHADVGNTLHNMGILLGEDLNDFRASVKFLERAVKVRRINKGNEHEDVADSLHHLAVSQDKAGRYKAAQTCIMESLRIRETFLDSVPDGENSDAAPDGGHKKNFNYSKLIESYELALGLRIETSGWKDADVGELFYRKGNIHLRLLERDLAIKCFEKALRVQRVALGDTHLSVANTLHNIGSAESDMGEYAKAVVHLDEALQLTSNILGSDHVDVAATQHNLASACRHEGQLERAMELYESALQVRRTILGGDDLLVADTLHNLGLVCEKMENHEKAMRCFMEALRVRKLKLGGDDLKVAQTLCAVAGVHSIRSEANRAVSCYREVLRIRRIHLDEDHIDIADPMHDLGCVFDSKEDFDDALLCYEAALKSYRNQLSTMHLKVARTQMNIGGVLQELCGYEEAMDCFEEALRIRKLLDGMDHSSVADVHYSMGNVHDKSCRYNAALVSYKDALRIYREKFGTESLDVAKALHAMSGTFTKKREYEKAERCCREALRIRIVKLGDKNEPVAESNYVLGLICEATQQYEDALECFEAALGTNRRLRGGQHVSVTNCLYHIALILERRGDADQALTCYKECLLGKKLNLGSDSADVGEVVDRLGTIHRGRAENTTALKCFQEALRIKKLYVEGDHSDIAHILLKLGTVYEALSNFDEAITCYGEALRMFKATLGEIHVMVAKTLSYLGGVHDEREEFGEAVDCLEESINVYLQSLPEAGSDLENEKKEDPSEAGSPSADHLDFADARYNLGTVYDKVGDFDKAAVCYENSLHMYQQLLGENHLMAAKAMDALSLIHAKRHDYHQAIACMNHVLRVRKLFLGEDDLEVASTLLGMGIVHGKTRDFGRALECYNEALRIRKLRLGNDDIEVARTLDNIGTVYGNMAELQKALTHWVDALRIYRSCGLAEDDPAVSATQGNIDLAKRFVLSDS